MLYLITYDYIKHGNARPGDSLRGPLFGVSHDTGNPGSTARENRAYFNNHQPSASAHVFIDDKEILVIIPLDEKAYHVQYQKPLDNLRFGEDANDAAIGIELCWGEGIHFTEAYNRYVWFWAWICKKYNWDPHEKIASHKQLDPQRRTDPDNALNRYGITFDEFLNDVAKEMGAPIMAPPVIKEVTKKTNKGYLEKGDRGEDVKDLQRKLNKARFNLIVDGIFGKKTDAAVRAFQRRSKIRVDGLAGEQTMGKLAVILRKLKYQGRLLYLTNPYMRGNDIKLAQKELKVKDDGILGPITDRAIRSFQRANSLAVDGKIGPLTWNKLFNNQE